MRGGPTLLVVIVPLILATVSQASCGLDRTGTGLSGGEGGGTGGTGGAAAFGGLAEASFGGTAVGGAGGNTGGSANSGGGDASLDAGNDADAQVDGEPDAPPVFTPHDISDLAVWLEADFPGIVLDGSSGVAVWPNAGSLGGVWSQSDPQRRPQKVTFAGKPAVAFVGNKITTLESTIPVAQLAFLHDGTGATAIALIRPNMSTGIGVVWITGGWYGADRGAVLYYEAAKQRVVHYLSNGIASVLAGASPDGALPSPPSANANTLTVLFDATVSPDPVEILVDGAKVGASGVSSLNASAPAIPLALGSNAAATPANGFNGEMFALLFYKRRLNAAELAQLAAYLGAKYQ